MPTTNHYGVYVQTEVPTTGVYTNHDIEWLSDELSSGKEIDIGLESFLEENPEPESWDYEDEDDYFTDHYTWRLDADFFESPGPILIGDWINDIDGKLSANEALYEVNGSRYAPDRTRIIHDPEHASGYAAIVDIDQFYTTQCVWSQWVTKAPLCSPCYPGQTSVDPDQDPDQYDQLTYSLPPDLLGEGWDASKIVKLEQEAQ